MRTTAEVLIPVRFLTTIGHFMATIMVFYTKDANIRRSMPLRDLSMYNNYNTSLFCWEALIMDIDNPQDLKSDHDVRPLFVCTDGRIILEAFSPIADHATDFLTAISEPVSRPALIHEYRLTEHSLYAAVSVGLDTQSIIQVLNRFCKTSVPDKVQDFIKEHTERFGKVKLVLKDNQYFLESSDPEILRTLLKDEVVMKARKFRDEIDGIVEEGDGFLVEQVSKSSVMFQGAARNAAVPATVDIQPLIQKQQVDLAEHGISLDDLDLDDFFNDTLSDTSMDFERDSDQQLNSAAKSLAEVPDYSPAPNGAEPKQDDDNLIPLDADINIVDYITHRSDGESLLLSSFEIEAEQVETVRRRCSELKYPVLEEYDFYSDRTVRDVRIDLKPVTVLRPYQEKSLNKMFGNSRARSGIVVLPCGAGKTLVGVTAACTIKKTCIVLCTSSVSVEQWAREFKSWSTIGDDQIAKFTSYSKPKLTEKTGVIISTYSMITFSGKRAYDTKNLIDFIKSREWGFLLLDEVHVVPADMFKKVLTIVAAHAKLGLTATLVREDDKIETLNYLIGPKLYEANWMDLAKKGHIANVQCAEVWCDMTKEFYKEYLEQSSRKRKLLYVMNPKKVQACQYLIQYHEARGDKVIVFSDNVFGLKHYAAKLGKPFIYGGTSNMERLRILQQFKYNPLLNTIFLSKVGDTSIDLPEASCLIQISSHFGSRRQEAQRLGRILRAKRNVSEGFNAFFYTLVSKDTEEVYYSTKRQQFLIDQGYSFKIITQLEGMDQDSSLVYSTLTQRLELLTTILVTNEENLSDLEDMEDEDDVMEVDDVPVARAPKQATRQRATMQSLSGADSMAYLELPRVGVDNERGRRSYRGRQQR
ncbi:hypothetical protein HDV05_007725 [Chytridiales sp. JEL 0842]|nr:hypothetical protein HDV05_007725 [Chytridiales sp. JEL 0842]